MNIDQSYFKSVSMPIQSVNDFMASGLKEIPKLKNLLSACKNVFTVGANQIQLSFLENRMYRIDVFGDIKKKVLLGSLYYVPNKKQLDIYDGTSQLPLLSFKGRKIVLQQFSGLISKTHIENIFMPLASAIA
jgi:hypothetical protein